MSEKTAEQATADSPAAEAPLRVEKLSKHRLPTGVLGIARCAESRQVFAACMDGVYTLNLDDGTHERLLRHASYAASVASLPDGETLVSAGYDGRLQWFDLAKKSTFRHVQAHSFWSWQMVASSDGEYLASATGQYLAGGNKYEPLAEREPSVKLYDARTGDLLHALSHVPPVQSVAFSPDSQFVAAGNLMGEVRVWNVASGEQVAQWTTDAFTSWGIIKSHCYIGGIYALAFSPGGQDLILAGMGPMRDPMAGNGRQLWQRFTWREQPARLVDQTHEGESGEGLMETLAVHPSGEYFLMGGRLRGGKWNAALFAWPEGGKLASLNTGYRMTGSVFGASGGRLITCGSDGQPKPKDGKWKPFGVVEEYELA